MPYAPPHQKGEKLATAAYQSSSEPQSGNFGSYNPSVGIREPANFLRRVELLPLKLYLRDSFKRYYAANKSPIGPHPKCWRGTRKLAKLMGCSHSTVKRHLALFRQFHLIELESGPNENLRSNQYRIVLTQFFTPKWPDGICPRCRHKHVGDECGCELTPRHWEKKGWVPRRCRCTPTPAATSGRIEPQRVENPSRTSPASPTPAQSGAAQPTAPPRTTPARAEHRKLKQIPARPLRSGETRTLGELFQKSLLAMKEYPPPEQALATLREKIPKDFAWVMGRQEGRFGHLKKDFWRERLSEALNKDCPHVEASLVHSVVDELSQELRNHGLHEDEVPNYLLARTPLQIPRSRKEAVTIICQRLNMNIERAIEHLRGAGHDVPDEEENP